MKTGFFETKPGEKSLSALISFMAFFASVFFGWFTMKLSAVSGSAVEVGIWITSGFLTLCGGVKLGRSGIEMWKDIKNVDSKVVAEKKD